MARPAEEKASTDIISVGICRGAYSIGENMQRSGGYAHRRRIKRPVTNTQRCIAFGHKRIGQQKSKKEKEGGTGRFYLYASMCTVPF